MIPDPFGRAAIEERRAAWYSSTDRAVAEAAYAAVLRRQFGPTAGPAVAAVVETVDVAGERL